jgi:NTE family protein
MQPESLIPWLAAVEAFSALGEDELAPLVRCCTTRQLARGDVLASAGERAATLHIVLSGRLIANTTGRDAPPEYRQGMVIGEALFFAGGVWPAAITALRDSLLLSLDWDDFAGLAARAPGYWQVVARSLASRTPHTTGRIPALMPRSREPRLVTLVPAGPVPLPKQVLTLLAEAFDSVAECQLLNSASFGQNLPGGISLETPEAALWLREQQKRFELILRVADPTWTDWTKNAVTEADTILLIGMHDGKSTRKSVALNPVEQRLFEARPRAVSRLLLVHRDHVRDGLRLGTRRWLKDRPVPFVHHIEQDAAGDYARAARYMLGRAAVYIAGGAGVYAAAHLGIVQALMDTGQHIDGFAGTGSGAIAAALLAAGIAPEEAADGLAEMRGRAEFERMLQDVYNGAEVVDFAMPYRALSLDLTTGQRQAHEAGPVAEALAANGSAFGAPSPYATEGGTVLLDGSVADACPGWLFEAFVPKLTVLANVTFPPLIPAQLGEAPADARGWPLLRFGRRETAPASGLYGDVLPRGLCLREPHTAGPGETVLTMPLPDGLDVNEPGFDDRLRRAAYEWAARELASGGTGEP